MVKEQHTAKNAHNEKGKKAFCVHLHGTSSEQNKSIEVKSQRACDVRQVISVDLSCYELPTQAAFKALVRACEKPVYVICQVRRVNYRVLITEACLFCNKSHSIRQCTYKTANVLTIHFRRANLAEMLCKAVGQRVALCINIVRCF